MSMVPMSSARVSLNPELVNNHPAIYISMATPPRTWRVASTYRARHKINSLCTRIKKQ